MSDESDLRLTMESAITNAFAETAQVTGLRSGPATDQLRAAIMKNLLDIPYYWSLMLDHLRRKEPAP